jgi:hypothetical protein
MHFTTLLLATSIAFTAAIPLRGSADDEGAIQPQHFRNGRPNRRPNDAVQPGTPLPQDPSAPLPTLQPTPGPPSNNTNTNTPPPPNQNTTFDPSLVPDFGIEPNQQPDGTGNCVGNNGVLIPCTCPPDRADFIQQVQAAAINGNSAGVPISFPTGDSDADKRARIAASIVVLQNLNGRGVGCPAAATTFLQQLAALGRD